ncbi:hypothetical protein GCM10009764_82020 [Nocardia ninae]|uniref:Uncharacterized protein n=1 Tax=Nocardia ninae NBRC 108245 TaxID=1210091 RepID=A0A511M7I1_9NOCA|nr:hypothetical protein NN4_10880 [Nocardia ninae NBRC 108245]
MLRIRALLPGALPTFEASIERVRRVDRRAEGLRGYVCAHRRYRSEEFVDR